MFNLVHEFLESKPKKYILAIGLLLLILICIIDYLSGKDYELDLFYLLPIMFIAWYKNIRWAVAVSVLTTIAWAVIDKMVGKISPNLLVDIWNSFIELSFFLAFVWLLSLLKSNASRLHELAHEDSLTGIANRRSFYAMVEAELNRSQRFGEVFSIAYIDIDDFKKVNDTQGHHAGDTLLCDVTTTIRQHIRNIDTVARLGGDEFAILFPETNSGEAKTILEKIKRYLNESIAGYGGPITFSIGVVTFSEPPASAEEMIRIADKVMYSVKLEGKNSITYESWPTQLATGKSTDREVI